MNNTSIFKGFNKRAINQSQSVTVNKVLKDTYRLLSATLIFSGLMAFISMAINFPHLGFLNIFIYFGLLFLTYKTSRSPWGLVSVFALTGFLGLTLGPILNFYLTKFSNGSFLVGLALFSTGAIFLSLSLFAINSKKDFSFMGGFLSVGIIIAFVAGLIAYFFTMSILALVVSAAFVILSSGLILYQTSEIIHGGERNYILATITLYVSIYNLFLSLLHLLGAFSGED